MRWQLARLVTAVVVLAALMGSGATTQVAATSGPVRGGKAVSHRAGGKPIGKLASEGRYFSVGGEAHEFIEPTLGIARNGDVFFPGLVLGSATNSPVVLRSKDEGRSWTDASPTLAGVANAHALTLDPYVYMDEDTGRLFDIDLTVACSYLSFSDDLGKSWTTNPIACGRPVNDHQTLFSGPPAISPTTVYDEVVYYCWNDFGTGTSCSKSLDGGISWIHTGQAFLGVSNTQEGPELCGGFNGHGVVGPDGTVFLPKEYCGQPWLGISHDEGLTWDKVQVADNTTEYLGSDTSVGVDAKGNLYYTYETAKQQLFLVTSKDGGYEWSKPMMVAAPGVEEVNLPTLDVGKPGSVAIGYMGTTNSPFAKCDPDCATSDWKDSTWNGYITMSTNALDKNPLFVSATVNHPSDPLYRGRCDFNSGRCGPILDFADIEIAPDGTPYAAFIDACYDGCATEGAAPSGTGKGVLGQLVRGPRLR